MGACDDRDATLDAKDVSIGRTARLARVSLSLSRARATRGRRMMPLAPATRGADPGARPVVGASSAGEPTPRETIGARWTIATIAIDASPVVSRASIARRTRVARGKVQGAPSCESPKPDLARRASSATPTPRDGEGAPREDADVVEIHARAFPSRNID